jgi:plasmid stabilization system protein ParE
MKYEVIVLPSAERDLSHIIEWIFKRSPQGAETWLARWDEVVLSLTFAPERFSLAAESSDHSVTIQQVIFRTRRGKPYRALFTVRDQTVFILHVRGFGQKLLESVDLP